MQTFFIQVIQWWIVVFILGIVVFPFVAQVFSSFFDRGYAFTKTVGMIAFSYCVFVFGTLHILQFSFLSLLGIGAVFIILFVIGSKIINLWHVVRTRWRILLAEEIIFIAGLLLWSYIKGFQPDIHGLEKFMDYGFINSILRSQYFPPRDMWMSPLPINYYYFGHLTTAVLTRLSQLPSNITFNLMLATLFASTFLGSFSIGANLVYLLTNNARGENYFKKDGQNFRSEGSELRSQENFRPNRIVIAGLISAFLVTLAGNLHAMYTFFTPYKNDFPVPPSQLVFSPLTFPNQYWYPNATRFIYHTIHEFPIYSFVVSDLHGHVLDIPLVLLILAVFLIIFIKQRLTLWDVILLGTLTGIAYMTNAWDGLIYIGVGILVLFGKLFTISFMESLFSKKFLVRFFVLVLSFIIVSLPFSLFFKPFANQIGFNCPPQFLVNIGHIGPILFESGYCQHSPFWQLAILYGFFFFWFVSLVTFLFAQNKREKELNPVDIFVLCVGLLGFVLIVIPEFVYLKDIYTTYFRANTMFKLVYQSFILLSLVSGYAIVRILTFLQSQKKNIWQKFLIIIYWLPATMLFILVSIYPYFAVSSYFNNLKDFHGLDGTTYLKNISPDDYLAINWMNRHIKGQPVIVEAQGDSYTDYERISSNTGLPTIFGWTVHEWLWRGTYNIAPPRIEDVKTVYESSDIPPAQRILRSYHVQYVYIGDMERSKYLSLHDQKFRLLGQVIYHHGSVTIYKLF